MSPYQLAPETTLFPLYQERRHADRSDTMQITNFWRGAHLAAASVLGGYAFTWGFSALGSAGLVALGVDFHEAETGVLIMAFLVFLAAFMWSFSVSRLAAVWAWLAGGGLAMTAVAWLIQKMLLQGA
jgi:hypothetical protein